MSLSGTVSMPVTMTETRALDLSTTQDPVAISSDSLFSFTDGTGALGVQVAWHDTITLADGGNEEIDLAGGKTNAFGQTVTFTKIKAMYFKNNSSDADLEIGGAAANQFLMVKAAGDAILVKPGGVLCIATADADGYPVTAGTGDLLRIEHDGTGSSTMDVDIYIAGEGSAA